MVSVSISILHPKFKVRPDACYEDVLLELNGFGYEIKIWIDPKQARKLVEKISKVLEEIEKLRKCMEKDC